MALSLSSISPLSGPIAGGTPIALTVSINSTSANNVDTLVAIGDVPVTNVNIVSTGLITGNTGPADNNIAYLFTIHQASTNAGSVYSNNGNLFTIVFDASNDGFLLATASSYMPLSPGPFNSGAPTASGNLVLVSGGGDAVINFSVAQIVQDNSAVIIDRVNDQAVILPNAFAYLEPGQMCLDDLITAATQRANMENSQFISYSEWTSYVNQSAYELYDLLITAYGNDYYCAQPLQFSTNGISNAYPLPNGVNYNGAPAFYKLLGVDFQITGTGVAQPNASSWVTIKPFKFSDRNKWSVPSSSATFWGFYNLQYRLNGSNMLFQPTPAGGSNLQLWYIPRLTQLVYPTDVLDGISGWTEYVIVDAAIKALIKEESDISALALDKADLAKRINATAEGRDAGFPQKVGDVANLDWTDQNTFGGLDGQGTGY